MGLSMTSWWVDFVFVSLFLRVFLLRRYFLYIFLSTYFLACRSCRSLIVLLSFIFILFDVSFA